jgi:hypothetical protein
MLAIQDRPADTMLDPAVQEARKPSRLTDVDPILLT